jgi:DNA-binding NarL/FixJ family response regulator
MTRVMIVDDHPIWRDAIERDLTAEGFEVVAAVGDGETAARLAPATRPDVVLMDLQLPGITGVEATGRLVAADSSIRVLMFSASGEDRDVLDAVKAGARGYIVKSAARADLIDALNRTADGEAVYSPGLAALVLGEFRRISTDETAAPELTERETEILRLVAKGLTAKRIAERLVLSPRTVGNHVQNTLRKLQLHNRVELTRWAIERGLDRPDD